MEKEAQLRLDRRHAIRLQYPLLASRAGSCFVDLTSQLEAMMTVVKLIGVLQDVPRSKIDEFIFTHQFDHKHSIEIGIKPENRHTLEFSSILELMDDLAYPYKYVDVIRYHKKDTQHLYCSHNYKWFLRNIANIIAMEETRIEEIECTCKGDEEHALLQILPVGLNAKPVICYNSCLRTLFAAFKRQLKQVFPVDPQEMEEFGKFCKQMIDTYLLPHLLNFDYSYSQWYNKMPAAKQRAMDKAKEELDDADHLDKVRFGLFCKREKQELGGKNRAIANIDAKVKYIMGPVCWALEDICDKYFPGYCGKKNWDDLETYYMDQEQKGFVHVLQGDGSGFDLSQHAEIKEYVDFYIYKHIVPHIHHVHKTLFADAALNPLRELNAQLFSKKKNYTLGHADIYGTVFSGASDTTLMNTLRMALYNHYTLTVKGGMRYGVDYNNLAKGDDFIVFTRHKSPPNPKYPTYSDLYYSVWQKKDKKPLETQYAPYGIGQILKFLVVGTVEDIDFCSTAVIRGTDGKSLKIVRRPERMEIFDAYSRSALKLSNGARKQFLLDLATALEISHGRLPFYEDYIDMYRFWASKIKEKTVDASQGPRKKWLRPDGHRYVQDSGQDNIFENYGHDFVRTFLPRYSTHEVDRPAVYRFLLDKYNISQVDVINHRRLLKAQMMFDHIQQSIDELDA